MSSPIEAAGPGVSPPRRRHRFAWRPLLLGTLAFAAAWAAVLYIFSAQLAYATSMPWQDAWDRTLFDRGPWVLLSPAVYVLCLAVQRMRTWWAKGLAHLAGATACVLLAEVILQGVIFPLTYIPPVPPGGPGGPYPPPYELRARPPHLRPRPPRLPDRPVWGSDLLLHAFRKTDNWVPMYLLLATLSHVIIFARDLRERERRVSELERRLLEARADLLRLQLEPHFLFNTLNAIATLVYRDAALADNLIAQLATLLRRLLDLRNEHLIPLRDEMAVLRAYIAIEQARFEKRLRFEEDVGSGILDFPVPVLLLQPIAENAIRHGIEPLGRPGTLRFSARREEDGILSLKLEDDGVGLQENPPDAGSKVRRPGIGLENVRQRLKVLYGDAASLMISPGPYAGVQVELRIPDHSRITPAQSPT